MMIPDTITMKEATARYKCDRKAIGKAVNDGLITAYKPGREIQLVKAEADKWYFSTRIKPKGRPRKNARRIGNKTTSAR